MKVGCLNTNIWPLGNLFKSYLEFTSFSTAEMVLIKSGCSFIWRNESFSVVSIFEENIFVGNLEVQQLIWLPYYCYIHLRTCIVIKNFFQMVFIQTKLPTRCPKYDQSNMFQHHPTPYSNTISIHLKTIFRALERYFCFCNFFNNLWYKQ